tara:strand:+ start:38474 stop:38827 length:354 start_codon:yes stop_codon:yes gene_type:complete
MKDFKVNKEVKDAGIVDKKEQHHVEFIGSMIRKKGHGIFELNTETFKVREIFPVKMDLELGIDNFNKDSALVKLKKDRYEYNKNNIYTTALNMKNAARKLSNEVISRGVRELKNNPQ